MSKRRVNFGAITSEAARRQLMLPVPCWERRWMLPENAAPGSTLKVFKWVKTDKRQQFSEDEEEADQPLAPLQDVDDVEVLDEDMDQDESATGENSRAVSEPAPLKDPEILSKAATPKPHPLSVSFQPPSPPSLPQDHTDDSHALTVSLDAALDGTDNLIPDHIINLDISQLDPVGDAFGDGDSLLQVQDGDALLGAGQLMDETGDPFAPPP